MWRGRRWCGLPLLCSSRVGDDDKSATATSTTSHDCAAHNCAAHDFDRTSCALSNRSDTAPDAFGHITTAHQR